MTSASAIRPAIASCCKRSGQQLADYNFDAKKLIRDICNSRTYQLSEVPNETNKDDADQFSRAHLRRLRADVLLDAIAEVTATPTTFGQTPAGLRAVQLDEGNRLANNYFLKTFGLCSRESVSASETRMEPTLAQALHLVNGDTVEGKLNRSKVDLGPDRSQEIARRYPRRTVRARRSAQAIRSREKEADALGGIKR